MDPLRRAQIILLCDLCKTAHLQSHCERCDISLCKVCVGEHLENTSIQHKVVPYKYRKSLSYSQCPDHAEEYCTHYCETCDIPVCSTCVSSAEHEDHDTLDILEKLDSKTEKLQRDLEELETRIYPRHEEIASDVQIEKIDLETNYGKLTTAADQQGEILHREITAIVNQRKSAIQEMKNKHLSTLNKNTEEITLKITELKQIIADLKSMLKSNDVSLTSTYKSRNSKFRTIPPNVRVTLPSFSPGKINKDQLNEMFGSLSSLSINTEHDETMKSSEAVSSPPVKPMKSPEAVSSPPVKPMKSAETVSSPPVKPMKSPEAVSSPPVKQMTSPETVSSPPVKPMTSPEAVSSLPVKPVKSSEAVSSPPVKPMTSPEAVSSPFKPMTTPEAVLSPPVKPLLDEPRFTATIDTRYRPLYSVRSPSEDKVWACSEFSNIMDLLNVQGKLLKSDSIQTKSGDHPGDITVTRDRDLVYTDPDNKTINLVKNNQIRTVITLQGWVPRNVCSTASDDLLVTMDSDDRKRQSKVVRYSGFTETQTIQFDDQGYPLYTANYTCSCKYVSENRNLDICVADNTACQVVVVNQSGKLRFMYTGHGHPSNTKGSFYPYGITTDSHSHILIADLMNNRIHILDQDGQFLRYIQNLHRPYGLCVDSRDNLYVAEKRTGKVKKIQYL